jgi:threonine/homoserine/homoserine lactone efflux protein
MNFITLFFIGFVAAIVGSVLPGLINLTAAKVAMLSGKLKAFWFSLGASIIVFFQAFVAILFARYIDLNPIYKNLIQILGLIIFMAMSYYFIVIANKKKPYQKEEKLKIRTKSSRFFLGMLVSILNFFPIPYYAIMALSLSAYNQLSYEYLNIFSISIGAMLGALLIFMIYAYYFNSKKQNSFIYKNINYIIGGLTTLVSVLTLFNLIF